MSHVLIKNKKGKIGNFSQIAEKKFLIILSVLRNPVSLMSSTIKTDFLNTHAQIHNRKFSDIP